MENCLLYKDEVMEGFVHKCVQQTHHLALQLENIEKHSSSLEHIEWFSILPKNRWPKRECPYGNALIPKHGEGETES